MNVHRGLSTGHLTCARDARMSQNCACGPGREPPCQRNGKAAGLDPERHSRGGHCPIIPHKLFEHLHVPGPALDGGNTAVNRTGPSLTSVLGSAERLWGVEVGPRAQHKGLSG